MFIIHKVAQLLSFPQSIFIAYTPCPFHLQIRVLHSRYFIKPNLHIIRSVCDQCQQNSLDSSQNTRKRISLFNFDLLGNLLLTIFLPLMSLVHLELLYSRTCSCMPAMCSDSTPWQRQIESCLHSAPSVPPWRLLSCRIWWELHSYLPSYLYIHGRFDATTDILRKRHSRSRKGWLLWGWEGGVRFSLVSVATLCTTSIVRNVQCCIKLAVWICSLPEDTAGWRGSFGLRSSPGHD